MRRVWMFCLLLLAMAVFAWGVMIYRHDFIPLQESQADLVLMSMLKSYNDQIASQGTFTPPSDDLITPDQLRRFIAVQRETRTAADSSFTKVHDRVAAYDEIVHNNPQKRFDTGLEMRVVKGLGPAMTHVKVSQVAALNHQGFSLKEYHWVRDSILRAMGRDTRAGASLAILAGEVDRTELQSRRRALDSEPRIPAENIALVKSASDSLADWVPMSVFGW